MVAANSAKNETAKVLYEQIAKEAESLNTDYPNNTDRLNRLSVLTQCFANVSDGTTG